MIHAFDEKNMKNTSKGGSCMAEGAGGIPDCIATGLHVLFIGYNPSLRSGELGHNYASRNNRFWKLLHESGLTEERVDPMRDRELISIGYGFTNIVARPTRRAEEITKEEYAQGRVRLAALLREYRPRIACYVGKGVYEQYTRRTDIPWGLQPASTVEGVLDFVVPSSSGLVRMPYAEILAIYQDLARLRQANEEKSDEIRYNGEIDF